MANEVNQNDRRSDARLIAGALLVAVLVTVGALALGAGLLARRVGALARRRAHAGARLEVSGAELARLRVEALPAARRRLAPASQRLTGEALTSWALALIVLDEIAMRAELDDDEHRRAGEELLEQAGRGGPTPAMGELEEMVGRARR